MIGASFYDQEPERPYTHLRIVAVEATATATLEVTGLARGDVRIDEQSVVVTAPRAIRFSAAADQGARALSACTPLHLAQAVWGTRTPQVLVGHGAPVWDHLPLAITRPLARIDMARVARLVWPGAPGYGAAALVGWLGLEPAVLALPQGSPEAPTRTVLEIAALLVTATYLTRETWEASSSAAVAAAAAAVAGDLAGDPVLQMMVDLSLVPAPPVDPVPSSTDSWAAWHGLGGSDLAWIANDPASPVFECRAARAELQRRATRNADPVTAAILIRRTGSLSRR